MTAEEHIHAAMTAALAHRLAGHPARATACVLLATVPVFAGLISWQAVQRVASGLVLVWEESLKKKEQELQAKGDKDKEGAAGRLPVS